VFVPENHSRLRIPVGVPPAVSAIVKRSSLALYVTA